MIKRLLTAWALLGVLAGWSFATKDPHNLAPTIAAMKVPGVTTTVTVQECGQPNGFYDLKTRSIIICSELFTVTTDETVHAILAHELAHGIIHQLNIPFTGNEEAAADELSAVLMDKAGLKDDMKAVIHYLLENDHGYDPLDDHPPNVTRALSIAAVTLHVEPDYKRIVATWDRLLRLK